MVEGNLNLSHPLMRYLVVRATFSTRSRVIFCQSEIHLLRRFEMKISLTDILFISVEGLTINVCYTTLNAKIEKQIHEIFRSKYRIVIFLVYKYEEIVEKGYIWYVNTYMKNNYIWEIICIYIKICIYHKIAYFDFTNTL